MITPQGKLSVQIRSGDIEIYRKYYYKIDWQCGTTMGILISAFLTYGFTAIVMSLNIPTLLIIVSSVLFFLLLSLALVQLLIHIVGTPEREALCIPSEILLEVEAIAAEDVLQKDGIERKISRKTSRKIFKMIKELEHSNKSIPNRSYDKVLLKVIEAGRNSKIKSDSK